MLLRAFLSVGVAIASGIQGLENVDNLIVFGDSYTDYGRLGWFLDHHGEAPPTGTFIEPSNKTASGGHSWPYFAAQDLNATPFNYAGKSGVLAVMLKPRSTVNVEIRSPRRDNITAPPSRA